MENTESVNLDSVKLIEERIEYYQKLKTVLEKRLETCNGLISFYDLYKSSGTVATILETLQYKYESAKLEMEEFDIRMQIEAAEQNINEYISRQRESEMMKAHANSIRANYDVLKRDVESIIRGNSIPPQIKDRVESLYRQIEAPEFKDQNSENQDRAYLLLHREVHMIMGASKKAESKIKLLAR